MAMDLFQLLLRQCGCQGRTCRPSTRMETRPVPPAPRETRPALLTYSEGSLGKSKSTTCSTWAESIPREALSVHTSAIGTGCIGGARNVCSNAGPGQKAFVHLADSSPVCKCHMTAWHHEALAIRP